MLEMNKMKLNSTGLSGLSLDQEMAKTAQARKGIQTSQDGELEQILFVIIHSLCLIQYESHLLQNIRNICTITTCGVRMRH